MKVYTRTGDKGETSVIGGRVLKDDDQVEAYGTIDELNGFVGQAISMMDDEHFADLKAELLEIQHELFDCGADLAFVTLSEGKFKVHPEMVERLNSGWIYMRKVTQRLRSLFFLEDHYCRPHFMYAVQFAAAPNAGWLRLVNIKKLTLM
ncbi:cob(I)alamin adenosyltransferase [Paenibacillus pini JCM 16418]|uniref:Corrinoid adenosyltransferase n=1 Tax=Paenibacillus pini JCM 16418 TaxID=1236976 RepID=W7YCM6_9BACL|nr:cob(I)alamin adenosyltransferase [Paenibacillus pini JCM 16418]